MRVSFEYDDNTMEEIISITALYVREHLLPVINQVFDFNSYIEYLKNIQLIYYGIVILLKVNR